MTLARRLGNLLAVTVWSASLATASTPPGDPVPTDPSVSTGALAYAANFAGYDYFIETVGWVTIEDVTWTDGRLTALYTYVVGSETRKVRSLLTRAPDGLYRGTCTTTVHGRPRFEVRTTLRFAEDGTASGNWAWSGEPSPTDPVVSIRKHVAR